MQTRCLIGKNGALTISMKATRIQPDKIDCFSLPAGAPTEKGCADTLDIVPFDNIQQTFGPRQYPNVDVGLPKAWKETGPHAGCTVALNTDKDVVVTYSWNKLWLLGTVINAVCVRQGRGGIYHWKGK